MNEQPEMLYQEDAIERREEIERLYGDDEQQHIKEDELYLDFIKCVAFGMYQPDEAIRVAQELLQTQKIEFERWCA